jgi:hypothetical protein
MKKYVWVVALVLVSTFAATAAADVTAQTRQDQAFVASLAQPSAQPVKSQACLASAATIAAVTPAATCINLACDTDFNCESCPGGLSAWYCATVGVYKKCVPY